MAFDTVSNVAVNVPETIVVYTDIFGLPLAIRNEVEAPPNVSKPVLTEVAIVDAFNQLRTQILNDRFGKEPQSLKINLEKLPALSYS